MNCLIGELKLSYRKVSTIIGESLARVRRWVNRSAKVGSGGAEMVNRGAGSGETGCGDGESECRKRYLL